MVSPKAIAVAGLSALAIAVSGCSGDSDPDALRLLRLPETCCLAHARTQGAAG